MLLRVNKNTGSHRQPVTYAALSVGTVSHVWYEDEAAPGPKRRNRIKMTRDMSAKPNDRPEYDA